MRDFAITLASRVILGGGVVAYPTEGVWGIGCDPLDQAAVLRVLELKARAADRGFILIAAQAEQLAPFVAPLERSVQRRLNATWPGPVTWIVPARPGVPAWLTGGRDSVAVRITAHPTAAALCARAGMALVSTSANPSGRPPARSALRVRLMLGSAIDYLVPGQIGPLGRPTEIRDARDGRTVRAGTD